MFNILMSKELTNLLNELELLSNEAVYFIDEVEKWNSLVSSETRKKLEKIHPTAIYIFNGVPYILFFDLTNCSDIEQERNIHKQVWSFDQAPLAFVIKTNEVKIYNAFSYEKAKGLQEIELTEGQTKKDIFSFWKLQSGSTWKWLQEYSKNNKQNERLERVHQKLFDNIKHVREKLKSLSSFSEDDSNTLILRLIFIRYLIDRGVKISPEFITGKTIVEKRISFSELIKNQEKLSTFFTELNEIFNGVLFKDSISLSLGQTEYLAWVFSEKDSPNQNSLFDGTDYYFNIFDFNIIPVEMISGIYESLIDPETKNADSAFYTPLFIVEHILSKTIDEFFKQEENKNKSECKVFDASVGSGIFLVQSFRRMVDREIELTSTKNISKERLSDIAVQNLWGIDINPEALKVATFSVYIAILDFEEPGTIMDKFHFRDLNFYQTDFFETQNDHILNETIKNIPFDFLLGNPPWRKDKKDKHLAWVNSRNIYNKKVVGEIEIAQSFLLRALDFMKENTTCSLIVSSPIFYNISSTSRIFKSKFLTSSNISSILDLSPVRRYIFDGKKIEVDQKTGEKKTKLLGGPALIITFKKTNGNYRDSLIEHTSVKSNLFTKQYKALVIEKFDRKKILQSFFIDNEWMFKVALYGNILDYSFLHRIETHNTKISDLIDNITTFSGAGVKSNKGDDYADFLIGLPLIENKEIDEYYTFISEDHKKLSELEVWYESGRKKQLFYGYKLLIKEQAKNESNLVISYIEKACAYKNGIGGICSENSSLIKELFSYLISDFYTYYIFITSCAWGVSTRPQIRLDEEYLSFRYKESVKKNELIRLAEKVIEPIIQHYSSKFPLGSPKEDEFAKEKINQIINQTYQIDGYEQDLIDYVLNVSRYQFQESKIKLITDFTHRDKTDYRNFNFVIEQYAEVFFSEIEPIYPDEHVGIDVYKLNHFIALNFVLSKEKPAVKINFETKEKDERTVLNKIAHTASISELSKDIFIQKDIKGFESDSFYIIKPYEYKCWHKAMAWYDVAEIKQMIEADELEYLIENPDAV